VYILRVGAIERQKTVVKYAGINGVTDGDGVGTFTKTTSVAL
jgi:hypothetical protein